MKRRVVPIVVFAVMLARPAMAQQRPLVTEDPEPIGAGRVLLETGVDFASDQQYPVSGLEGDLWRVPAIGVSVGISSIAELQIDGGLFNHLSIQHRNPAPLSHLLTVTGTGTSDFQDIVIGTKIRLLAEGPKHPSLAFRFATKLPNTTNEKGLGLDTTDFYASLLAAKTVQSIRVVGNVGFGILADPTVGDRQNDVLTYGMSFARALTDRVRSGRGAERSRLDARRQGVSGNRNPRDSEPWRALHARVDSPGRRAVLWPHGSRSDDGLHGGVDVRVQCVPGPVDPRYSSYQLSAFSSLMMWKRSES